MSREVRITVDDDEVFERMKHRKRDLDLSWEEVLHRGLARQPHMGRGRSETPDRERRTERGRDRSRDHGRTRGRRTSDHHETDDRWDRFATGLEQGIQDKVYDTLAASFGAAGVDVPERPNLDDEVASLTSAEDATLAFDFLETDEAYEVPLRVTLETGPDGLTVDVIAVRHGKDVKHANSFDTAARKRVNVQLAAGDAANLRFDDGESYRVRPSLSWTRGDDGRPTVEAVDISEVLLDADPNPVAFSALCGRLGVSDTGRFNYHLNRLRGHLVGKEDEGYVLTPQGATLAGLLDDSVPT